MDWDSLDKTSSKDMIVWSPSCTEFPNILDMKRHENTFEIWQIVNIRNKIFKVSLGV